MKKNNYHKSILVNASGQKAMEQISKIDEWWKNDFTGSAQKVNGTFHVPFSGDSFVDFIVSELVPGKKTIWKVTDCFLPWFADKKEWNNTEVVFEVSSENNQTKIDFTHVGLVPEIECYAACESGWNEHLGTLERLLNEVNKEMAGV